MISGRPGGEVDDVGGVVGGDGLPADGEEQRGGQQRADDGGDALPQAEDGEDADDDLEEGDGEAGADGVGEREVAQRFGKGPRVQGVEPLDHGAALAAVEVDGVAELAHAGVDGDEAEEDAQREQDDAEVHPAAGVVGVAYGVVALALWPGRRPALVGRTRRRTAPVRGPRTSRRRRRLAAWAAGGACRGRRAAVTTGVARGVVELVDARDDLGRAGCRSLRSRRRNCRARPGVAHGLEQSGGAGVAGCGLAAPDDGGPPAHHPAGGADDGDAGGVRQGTCGARALGELHPEAGVVDDDLRGIAGTLTMLSAG